MEEDEGGVGLVACCAACTAPSRSTHLDLKNLRRHIEKRQVPKLEEDHWGIVAYEAGTPQEIDMNVCKVTNVWISYTLPFTNRRKHVLLGPPTPLQEK